MARPTHRIRIESCLPRHLSEMGDRINKETACEDPVARDCDMQKGFTRKPQEDEPATRDKNYITPSGLQRLKDEHRFLLTRERPAVTKVVTWAASNGDRSENADYQYGKRRLRQIDGRIRFLTKRIE